MLPLSRCFQSSVLLLSVGRCLKLRYLICLTTFATKEVYARFDKRNLLAYEILSKARTPYAFSCDELFVSCTGPFLDLIQDSIFGDDLDGPIKKAQDEFTKKLNRTNP